MDAHGNKCMSYPAMPEELAVAAVTVLSFFLVGGRGGGGAMLGTTVLVLTLLSIVRLVLVRPVPLTAVALTVRITEKSHISKRFQKILFSYETTNSPFPPISLYYRLTCRHWAGH